MKQQLETKRVDLSQSAVMTTDTEGQMEFTGYGAVFGNVDSYGDVIAPGAFKQYLADVQAGKQNWPTMLQQHGGWGTASDLKPVGVYTDLEEDAIGLKTTGLLADTTDGMDLYKLMKMQPRPAISGLSIGYFARESEYGSKKDPYERLIKRIDLVEISVVTFPANDKARVQDVKSGSELSDREFERLMLGAGFTRKEARIIMNDGFRSLKSTPGAVFEAEKAAEILQKHIKGLQRGYKHD